MNTGRKDAVVIPCRLMRAPPSLARYYNGSYARAHSTRPPACLTIFERDAEMSFGESQR